MFLHVVSYFGLKMSAINCFTKDKFNRVPSIQPRSNS